VAQGKGVVMIMQSDVMMYHMYNITSYDYGERVLLIVPSICYDMARTGDVLLVYQQKSTHV